MPPPDTTDLPDDRSAVLVIGGGPAGLMAAEIAAQAGAAVTVFERMPSVGRKFLLAGRGGLNLTHSEPFPAFVTRYGEAGPALHPALTAFDPVALRGWCHALGQPTAVGTSGRVFPQSFKASPLLRAWLRRLDGLGVEVRTRHRWMGWAPEGGLLFETPTGPRRAPGGATVLALGGASWPRLGSDGAWAGPLAAAGVPLAPLRPSNCGFVAAWSPLMGERFAGHPLQSIALRFGATRVRGEATVTATGLEGGAVYALSAALRDAIARDGGAELSLALRPDLRPEDIAARLARQPAKASLSTRLRKALRLSPVAIALVHEGWRRSAGAVPLATLVNAIPVRLLAPAPLDRAISTAGGVRLGAIAPDFMLHRYPGVFVAGEMLDWEAPTGGYLLQACFATGAAAGRGAAAWLRRAPDQR